MKTATRPSTTYELSGTRVRVLESGSDVPVLLIHHGLGRAELYTDPLTGNVAEWVAARGCRVLVPDLPGHGESQAIGDFADDYLDVCEALMAQLLAEHGPEHPVPVIGVGFGGLVALRLAARRDRLVSCALADSPPGLLASTPYEPWPALCPEDGPRERELASSWTRFAERLSGTDPYLDLLGHVRVPALLTFCGDADAPETARIYRMAPSLPADIAVLPGDAPPTCWHAPSFFTREMERFLATNA